MIETFLLLVFVVWFFRQFHGARAVRWQSHGRAVLPILKFFVADAKAAGRIVAHPILARRAARKTDLDAELRGMLGT